MGLRRFAAMGEGGKALPLCAKWIWTRGLDATHCVPEARRFSRLRRSDFCGICFRSIGLATPRAGANDGAPEMIELYQLPWSPFCLVQRRMLEYAGARY